MSVLAVTLHPDIPGSVWSLILKLFVQIQHSRAPILPLLCFFLLAFQLYTVFICAVGVVLADVWIKPLR